MLLHESRRAARTSPTGELVLLADQDRSLWNRAEIAEGLALVERALAVAPLRPVRAPGGDRRRPCQRRRRRRDRLGGDRRPLRCAPPRRPLAGGRAQPSRGAGDARRSRGGPRARSTRSSRAAISPTTSFAHSARADLCRRLGRTAEARAILRARPEPDAPGARAPVPRTTPPRARRGRARRLRPAP